MKGNSLKRAKERIRRNPAQTIMDADYADDITLLANTPAQAETQLHSLGRAAGGIGLHVNADKTEYMCFNQSWRYLHTKRYSFESSVQVNLLRKQRIINRDRHQHATGKGMDS